MDNVSEADLKKIRRSLVASKSWAKRCHSTLVSLLEDSSLDTLAVECAINELKKRLDAFDNAQGELELCVPDSELEECITEAGKFRDTHQSVLLKAERMLKDSKSDTDSVVSSHNSNSDCSRSNRPNVRLPKLDLPKFDGTLTMWQTFWDKFKALINDTDIPSVTKFTYLTSVLEGEAKKSHTRTSCHGQKL